MRYVAVLLVLAACNTATIGFRPDRVAEVAEGGHRFRVFVGDGRAQVVRLNRITLGQTRAVRRAALRAAEQVSGCRVSDVEKGSDQVLVRVALDCG